VRDDGGIVEDEQEIHNLITNFYKDLFCSCAGNRYDELLSQVEPKVTPLMNQILMKEFTDDEIKAALDSMGDLKAPGMDGMPALFFKQYWDTVGADVTREVKKLLQGGEMQKGWNETVVVLIPKVSNPERLKDLRPIGLCNVVYKIASKVLSNNLKFILPEIIALNQSAFVPGRMITDNVLLAYEMTHYMQTKRSGKQSYAAVKLDMSKAYDCVEWSFLEKMMIKLGFHERWVDTIMKCVTTVTYCIRVNGQLTDEIAPQRGLRQGDPLSPYLFLLCAEAFSCLLLAAERRGELEGVKVCQDAPSINHLLFADDSLLLLQIICKIYFHCMRIARGKR